MEDFKKEYKKYHHFFFSEIFTGQEEEAGHIIELMRIAEHIKCMHNFFLLLSPSSNMCENEEIEYQINMESIQIYALNLAASQIREALKLFGYFIKLDFYQTLKTRLDPNNTKIFFELEGYVNEFALRKGLLWDVLKPLRDKMFHYDHLQAKDWLNNQIIQEKEEKPRCQYINLKMYDFGPGKEYDGSIYSNFVWGTEGFNSFMRAQKQVFEIQNLFLEVVKISTEDLIKRAKIPKREYDWILKYRYGFNINK